MWRARLGKQGGEELRLVQEEVMEEELLEEDMSDL